MFYRNPSSLTCLPSIHPWFEHQALERPLAEGFCEIDIRHEHLIDMMSIARCGVVFDGTVEVLASVMRVWTYIVLFINSTAPLIYVGRKFGWALSMLLLKCLTLEYGYESDPGRMPLQSRHTIGAALVLDSGRTLSAVSHETMQSMLRLLRVTVESRLVPIYSGFLHFIFAYSPFCSLGIKLPQSLTGYHKNPRVPSSQDE